VLLKSERERERENVTPVTQETEIRRIMVQGQPGQKVSKTPSHQTSWVIAYACNSSYKGGIGKRITV
jgi:hypothetical protein